MANGVGQQNTKKKQKDFKKKDGQLRAKGANYEKTLSVTPLVFHLARFFCYISYFVTKSLKQTLHFVLF